MTLEKIIIDTNAIARNKFTYKRKLDNGRLMFKEKIKSGLRQNILSFEGEITVEAIENFWAVYGAVKSNVRNRVTDANGPRFTDLYSLYIAASYADEKCSSDIEKPIRYDRLVKLELPSDEYLLIDKLMMNFLTETNHCSSGSTLARTARGFFQRVQELSREMLNAEVLKQLNDFEKKYKIVIDSFTAQGTNVETEDPSEGKPSEIVTFDDIGGYQHIVEDLRFIVDTFKNPKYEAFNYKRPRGICFYGRPGTGKTLLGKAIACESDRPFHYLNVAQVLSKWVGESEKTLQNSLMKSGIHFLDEANSILGAYNQQDNATNERLIDIFAEAVNGYKSNPDAMYILATNTLKLNKKVKRAGRVDIYYEFGLPDAQAIYHVLNIHLNKLMQGASVPIVNGLDLNMITNAIYSTSVIANRKNPNLGIVPADCENILKRTHEKKVKEYWKTGQFRPMGTEDILETVKNYNLEARE